MTTRVKNEALRSAILHPARLEILRAFELHGTLTIGELATTLPNVSQPSLYRHVKRLLDVGVLAVRDVRQGDRGAPERVYAIADAAQLKFAAKGKERTRAVLRRFYTAMIAAQTAEFEKSLADGTFPAKYFHVRHALINVNEDELVEVRDMFARLSALSENPAKGRVSLDLGIALFPVNRRKR